MEQRKSLIVSTLNFLGGLSGLLSLALLVWKGGMIAQMVAQHETRIGLIESGGSGTVREHVKEDNERIGDLKLRMVRQEDLNGSINVKLSDLVGEVRVLNFKVDTLNEKLNGPKRP